MNTDTTTTQGATEREQFVAWSVQECMKSINGGTGASPGVPEALADAAGQAWDDGHMVARAWQAARTPLVPLTDEQIATIASTPCAVVGSYVHTFARAIESAHGITGAPNGRLNTTQEKKE